MNKTASERALTIAIADDIPSVRQNLRTLLTLLGGLEVVGEATNGEEAVHLAEVLSPDVMVMDLEMPIVDGIAATRRIKAILPECRVVVLTIHEGDDERRRARLAGADAFVAKGAPVRELVEAIRGRLPQI